MVGDIRCWGYGVYENPLLPWQFSSIQSLSHVRLCDPMNHSTPVLPVHHKLLEFIQTHVHWVGNAIQQSHSLSSPFPLALNLSQYQDLFQWMSWLFTAGSQSIGVLASASVLPMNIQDWFLLGWTGWISLQSKGLQEPSPTPQLKASILLCSAFFIVQLYMFLK